MVRPAGHSVFFGYFHGSSVTTTIFLAPSAATCRAMIGTLKPPSLRCPPVIATASLNRILSTRQRYLGARVGVGERPVRRRADARADFGGALYSLSCRGCDRAPCRDAADSARSRGSPGRRPVSTVGPRAAGAGAADRRGARLDPDRPCDAN